METDFKSPWKVGIAGSLAGMMSVLVCHPLDVIRTNHQLAKSSAVNYRHKFPSTCYNGIRGLYTGIIPPLCAQAVYKTIIFGSNNLSHKILTFPNNGKEVLISQKKGQRFMEDARIFTSGCLSGFLVSFVVAPVELVRTKLITRSGSSIKENISLSTSNFTKPWLLWANILPTLLRDGPGVGVYFLVYHDMKLFLKQRNADASLRLDGELSLQRRVVAACCAGISFWLWGLPFDTLKTVLEADASSSSSPGAIVRQCRRLWREGGIYRFYSAWPLAVGRGIPSAVVTLTVYDLALQSL